MGLVLFFAFLFSVVLFMVGIISPHISLFWYEKKRTRALSFLIYGILSILLLVTSALSRDSHMAVIQEDKTTKDQTVSESEFVEESNLITSIPERETDGTSFNTGAIPQTKVNEFETMSEYRTSDSKVIIDADGKLVKISAQSKGVSATNKAFEKAPPEKNRKGTSVDYSQRIDRIESAIRSTGNYEVTVWTANGDYATSQTGPPYQVFVNTSSAQIQDCFDAKNKLFNIMKSIYSDESLSRDVERVKFTAWGEIKASLGSADVGFDWNSTGPSNFWKIMHEYSGYEDETGALNRRTYGVQINRNCK